MWGEGEQDFLYSFFFVCVYMLLVPSPPSSQSMLTCVLLSCEGGADIAPTFTAW